MTIDLHTYTQIPNNTNALEGMSCPQCGNYAGFQIEAETIVEVFDNGVDSYSKTGWGDHSNVKCPECGWTGTVGLASVGVIPDDGMISLRKVQERVSQLGYESHVQYVGERGEAHLYVTGMHFRAWIVGPNDSPDGHINIRDLRLGFSESTRELRLRDFGPTTYRQIAALLGVVTEQGDPPGAVIADLGLDIGQRSNRWPDEYVYTVTITAPSEQQANEVMVARLNYDDDYGFPYTIRYER